MTPQPTSTLPPTGYLQTATGLIIPAGTNDVAFSPPFGYAGAPGNYTAAVKDPAQASIYFPERRSVFDITPDDRLTILDKARWATRNTGLGNRINEGIAEMVGALAPSPTTTDEEWNQLAKAAFEDVTSSALIFDQAGDENFEQRQLTLTKKLVEDGDCLLALTETASGLPSTALYESPQIGNPKGKSARDGWLDGVQLSGSYRRQAFGILDANLCPTDFSISAFDAIFFGDPKPHAPRGVSKFATFVKRLMDVRQMDNDQLAGIHAANLVGFYLKNNTLENAKAKALMDEAVFKTKFGNTPTADGDQKSYKSEDIFRHSGTMADLNIGQEFATVHDERRHPNTAEFVSYFIRDMAWGTGFPPEVIWFLGQLAGPGVRFMIKSGEKAAKRYRRILRERYCQRIWVWVISKLVKLGRLRPCNDNRWWKCEWLEPESLTIDLGRDIKAGLEEIRAGGNTYANWYGEVKQDWKEQFRQKAAELKEAAKLEKDNDLPPGSLLGQVIIQLNPNNIQPAQAA